VYKNKFKSSSLAAEISKFFSAAERIHTFRHARFKLAFRHYPSIAGRDFRSSSRHCFPPASARVDVAIDDASDALLTHQVHRNRQLAKGDPVTGALRRVLGDLWTAR